jgi:mannose-6-phosphate isomerase-like protein (cupin superfamily)
VRKSDFAEDKVIAQIVSVKSAEHYKWGAARGTDCDGWRLVNTPHLSVIEEFMPPGTCEARHSHHHAHQFFYILEGELTIQVEDREFVLHAHEGIWISPGQLHQAINRSANSLRMLVTSQPPSHGDRINA